MSPSLDDITSQMRATLAATDPDLDTSTGTTTRKILDAVAESIAESYLDQHMLAYTYDIDSKVEGDLDAFCQTVGGISRLAAKRATGTVTFARSGSATTTVLIPVATQVNSDTDPVIPVQTLSAGTMLPGQLTVTVPVQAVTAGPIGNLAPNSLTLIATSVEGVASVTNLKALTGGMDQETDNELRERWKKTAFRSMAGTESMYLGLALDDEYVTAAQVIGAAKRRREQVQVKSDGTAQSTVDDAAYVFPTGVFLGGNIDNGGLMIQGADYTWDTSVTPPRIVISDGVTVYDTGQRVGTTPVTAEITDAVLDLEFEYTPKASRNDPEGSRFGKGSVMSRVDIWCAGQRPVSAQQSVVFKSSQRFNAVSSEALWVGNFVRLDGVRPTANNVFVPLAFGPIIAVPDVLTIAGSTYGRVGAATSGIAHPNAYQIVHDDTPFGYTADSRFGLEWDATQLPGSNSIFTMGLNGAYVYNATPRTVQANIDRWRLAGVDAKTHAAKEISLRFNLAVMYDRGASQTAVNQSIDEAISKHLGAVGLGGVVQVSDVEAVVHAVPGVDNVRFLNWLDYPTWSPTQTDEVTNTFSVGIQRVVDGDVVQSYVSSSGRVHDIVFADNEVPVFESAFKGIKAQNTFRFA